MKNNYFYGVDFLRWIAAFGVVLYHYSLHFKVDNIDYNIFINYLIENREFAPKFVWLFWAISGFVFTNIYLNKNTNFKNFFVARFARLYPLHFVTLIIVAFLQFVSLTLFNHTQENYSNDFYHFFLHLFFASDWGFQNEWSYNTPVWSVSIEIPIYFLFFFSIIFLKKFKYFYSITAIIFFYYLFYDLIHFAKDNNWIETTKIQNLAIFNFLTCIFYFFLGSTLYFFYEKFYYLSKYLLSISFLSILLCLIIKNVYIFNDLPITKFLPTTVLLLSSLIIFFSCIDSVFKSIFKKIYIFSNTSYAIYMIHFPLQIIILLFIEQYSLDFNIFKNVSIFLIFIFILQYISYLSFLYLEKPARKIINNYFIKQ